MIWNSVKALALDGCEFKFCYWVKSLILLSLQNIYNNNQATWGILRIQELWMASYLAQSCVHGKPHKCDGLKVQSKFSCLCETQPGSPDIMNFVLPWTQTVFAIHSLCSVLSFLICLVVFLLLPLSHESLSLALFLQKHNSKAIQVKKKKKTKNRVWVISWVQV